MRGGAYRRITTQMIVSILLGSITRATTGFVWSISGPCQSRRMTICNNRAHILHVWTPLHRPSFPRVFPFTTSTYASSSSQADSAMNAKVLNLSTVTKDELESIVVHLGHPKYRANQVWHWIRAQGVTDLEQMNNIPKKLRQELMEFSKPSALEIVFEVQSKDGTIKRAYRCHDGQVIESVLMPYEDGRRYTACISSQAGCAQGCVFCATGQMGFSRQLTANEIFEQVARFAAELQQGQIHPLPTSPIMTSSSPNQKPDAMATVSSATNTGRTRLLSNVVFMGMGEPLMNYRNVKEAIHRMTHDLGIGARRITVSTVGIVPNIRQLYQDHDMPPVRLAVSLHCATDEERSALLPANKRYGGLDELMLALKEYMDATKQRITLEWALIEGQNDKVETARTLGNLIAQKYGLRRDMVHVNVIPLNPTGGYGGSPSGRKRVNQFCETLIQEFGIACTPRMRRGIDVNAGCGQLKAQVLEKKKESSSSSLTVGRIPPPVGVYEDDDGNNNNPNQEEEDRENRRSLSRTERMVVSGGQDTTDGGFVIDPEAVDLGKCDDDDDEYDYEDPEFTSDWELKEANRLIALVQGTTIAIPPTIHQSLSSSSSSPNRAATKSVVSEKSSTRKLSP